MAATFTATIRDIEEIQRRYAGAGEVILDELGKSVTTAMQLAEGAIKADIHEEARASGALMQSISYRVENIAGGVRGVAGPGARSVGAPATAKSYARYVIEGRRPGRMPPIEPLVDWVTVKNQYRPIFGIRSSDKAAVRRVAWAVAVNIAKRGIKPNDFMDRAIRAVMPMIEREVHQEAPKRIRARITGSGR